MRVLFRIALAGASALAAIGTVATANSQEVEPVSAAASRGVMQDRSYASPAEALYVEKCSMCHRQMGMGTVLLARRIDPMQAQLEDRAGLSAQFISLVVRRGIGNMPAIPPGEVSDEQLEIIANYLAGETAR
jgi:mono/diheme cytochrome c family protein